MNASFIRIPNTEHGIVFNDDQHPVYPLRVFNIHNGGVFTGWAMYLFVYEGEFLLKAEDRGAIMLRAGMYASVSGRMNLSGEGKAILIECLSGGSYIENAVVPGYKPGPVKRRTSFRPMFVVGGPLEREGRLAYIDGCTDSLLIPPVKMGDPCLNHLHFPAHIDQTAHTHPSHRIGVVVSGRGECITPFGNIPLEPGYLFVIKEWDGISTSTGLDGKTYPVGEHCFRTFEGEMDVIAFHPDSDFGATDEFHPMVNRTIVDGVSANGIDAIRTKL